jgi:hypothetical protein
MIGSAGGVEQGDDVSSFLRGQGDDVVFVPMGATRPVPRCAILCEFHVKQADSPPMLKHNETDSEKSRFLLPPSHRNEPNCPSSERAAFSSPLASRRSVRIEPRRSVCHSFHTKRLVPYETTRFSCQTTRSLRVHAPSLAKSCHSM